MLNRLKIFKNRFVIIVLSLLCCFLLGIYFIINILVPKELNLIVGREGKFNFNIPAQAVLLNDNNNSNSSPKIYLNNDTQNNSFKFNEPFSLSAEEECNAKLKLSILGIPIKEVNIMAIPETKLVPCGDMIGIRINTDGIMVLGIGNVIGENGKSYEPCDNILKAGDLIISIDGKKIENKEELINCIESNTSGLIELKIKRNNQELTKTIVPIKGADGKNKIGVWVRDSSQGVGTMTYFNPKNGLFGALGHGITDIDTRKLMSVKDGKIMKTKISSIKKGEKGNPGELSGEIKKEKEIGKIYDNNEFGIYGKLNSIDNSRTAIPIALHNEIKEGSAKILSCIEGGEAKEYNIEIISINRYNTQTSKSMVIKITDKDLLQKTNGIVQGMSGSPIIQDGKLIGAVTHVFVQEPDKGYGIFIENMLAVENQ